jgi:hypothetical protein
MAKFITTKQITSELSELIKKAGDRLYIVSPYLKLSKDFRDLLTYRNSNRKDTKIIFGKQELNPEQMTFLQGLRFVYLFFSEDLHAKCYINDTKMIITSMNLYDFSMINNKEMGILIDNSIPEDVQIYADAWVEIDFIEKTSKPFDFVSKPSYVEKTVPKENGQSKKIKDSKNIDIKEQGHCIRCNNPIALNPLAPYCKDCFNIWKKYGKEDYQEQFCHICGKDEKTSKIKPSCSNCYRTNKNKLEFPLTA